MKRRWLRTKERDRAIVYTTDEQVLDGLLVTDASDGIVLIDVRVRSDNDIALHGERSTCPASACASCNCSRGRHDETGTASTGR